MRLAANGTLYVTNGTVGTLTGRGAKQDFVAIDPAGVLDKVVQLPMAAWSYKNNPSVRHLGPTAQDFRAAFELGDDEDHEHGDHNPGHAKNCRWIDHG